MKKLSRISKACRSVVSELTFNVFEKLEDRQLLSTGSINLGVGDYGNDVYLAADGADVVAYDGTDSTGDEVDRWEIDDLTALTISGNSFSTSVTIDYVNGVPLKDDVLHYNGSTGNGSIFVVGKEYLRSTVSMNDSTEGSGDILIGYQKAIEYTNVEGITLSSLASVELSTMNPSADPTVDIDLDSTITITGMAGSATYTPVCISDVGAVTLTVRGDNSALDAEYAGLFSGAGTWVNIATVAGTSQNYANPLNNSMEQNYGFMNYITSTEEVKYVNDSYNPDGHFTLPITYDSMIDGWSFTTTFSNYDDITSNGCIITRSYPEDSWIDLGDVNTADPLDYFVFKDYNTSVDVYLYDHVTDTQTYVDTLYWTSGSFDDYVYSNTTTDYTFGGIPGDNTVAGTVNISGSAPSWNNNLTLAMGGVLTGSINVGPSSASDVRLHVANGANTALTVNNDSTVSFTGHEILSSLDIDSGTVIQTTSSENILRIDSLTITSSTGLLDLGNCTLVTDTDSVTLHGYLATGIGSAEDWTGTTGITSSQIVSDPTFGIGYGNTSTMPSSAYSVYNPDSTSTIVTIARYGDTNLDGVVDSTDETIINAFYDPDYTGSSGPRQWFESDFTYDGVVDDFDAAVMTEQYGLGSSLSFTVTDPGSLTTVSEFQLPLEYTDGNDTLMYWAVYWGDGSRSLICSEDVTSLNDCDVNHTYYDSGEYEVTAFAITQANEGEMYRTHLAGQMEVTVTDPTEFVSVVTPIHEYPILLGTPYEVRAQQFAGSLTITGTVIDWGDGSTPTVVTSFDDNYSHTYTTFPTTGIVMTTTDSQNTTHDSTEMVPNLFDSVTDLSVEAINEFENIVSWDTGNNADNTWYAVYTGVTDDFEISDNTFLGMTTRNTFADVHLYLSDYSHTQYYKVQALSLGQYTSYFRSGIVIEDRVTIPQVSSTPAAVGHATYSTPMTYEWTQTYNTGTSLWDITITVAQIPTDATMNYKLANTTNPDPENPANYTTMTASTSGSTTVFTGSSPIELIYSNQETLVQGCGTYTPSQAELLDLQQYSTPEKLEVIIPNQNQMSNIETPVRFEGPGYSPTNAQVFPQTTEFLKRLPQTIDMTLNFFSPFKALVNTLITYSNRYVPPPSAPSSSQVWTWTAQDPRTPNLSRYEVAMETISVLFEIQPLPDTMNGGNGIDRNITKLKIQWEDMGAWEIYDIPVNGAPLVHKYNSSGTKTITVFGVNLAGEDVNDIVVDFEININ